MKPPQRKNPEPRGNAASRLVIHTGQERGGQTPHDRSLRKSLVIRNAKGELVSVSQGTRLADVLLKLAASRKRGISTLDFPAGVRLGGLIFKLRRLGIDINTHRQPVPGDPYGAWIANYWLATAP